MRAKLTSRMDVCDDPQIASKSTNQKYLSSKEKSYRTQKRGGSSLDETVNLSLSAKRLCIGTGVISDTMSAVMHVCIVQTRVFQTVFINFFFFFFCALGEGGAGVCVGGCYFTASWERCSLDCWQSVFLSKFQQGL